MNDAEADVLADAAGGWADMVTVPAGGVVSTVHVAVATGPVLPAASIRRTRSSCGPSARAERATGLVHDDQAAESSEHCADSPAPAPVNATDPDADADGSEGCDARVVAPGATVSSVHARVAAGPVLPAASTRRTRSSCGPSARASGVYVEGHAAQAPASRRHSYDSPAPAPVNVKVGWESALSDAGPVTMTGGAVGAPRSTSHE